MEKIVKFGEDIAGFDTHLFHRILLCTDNSADAKAAELFAIKLASTYKAELLILHIYEMPSPPEVKGIYVDEFEIAYKHQQCSKLSERFNGLEKIYPAIFIAQPRAETIADSIIKEADKNKCTLIIAGTHGASGFLANSFGSNTLKIILESAIPVLAVPSYTIFKGFRNISIASKSIEEETKILKQYLPWLKQIKAHINFIHIQEPGGKIISYDQLQTFHESLPTIKTTLVNIKTENITEALEAYTEQNEVDCLLLFSENKNIFDRLFAPNIVKRMLYQLEIPILCIPK